MLAGACAFAARLNIGANTGSVPAVNASIAVRRSIDASKTAASGSPSRVM